MLSGTSWAGAVKNCPYANNRYAPSRFLRLLLDVGELWLYDQQLQRIVPVAEGQRCMAVLVGSKQLARI